MALKPSTHWPSSASHLPPTELAEVVREVVARRSAPVSLAQLRRDLPRPFRLPLTELQAVVRALVAAGALFELPGAKVFALTTQEPAHVLERVLPTALGDNVCSLAALKGLVKRDALGFERAVDKWLPTAIKRGVLFAHPGAGAKTKRYGARPFTTADLQPLVQRAVDEVQRAATCFAPFGMEIPDILDALAARLLPPDGRALLLRVLERLTAQHPDGTLFSFPDVRPHVPLSKAAFDRAALSLATEGVLVLHHHDFPASLSPEERHQLVSDASGVYYLGVAWRRKP